jgi:hypothetical protein
LEDGSVLDLQPQFSLKSMDTVVITSTGSPFSSEGW